ncbi:MAG: helix-turn-helix domain-containing protein [Oscillospiraceae bacterium]|nr:helix-turn-helix domain-containing protein [Oscillospiraceae bacterium]
MTNPKDIGRRIEHRRKELNLTLKDVADRAGVSLSTISRYERGEFDRIKLPVVVAIANALHVSHDYIVCKCDAPVYLSVPNDPLLNYLPALSVKEANNIAQRIRSRREELGLTIDEVAKRIHLPPATITKLEHGQFDRLDPNAVHALARVLATSYDYLLCNTDDPLYSDADESHHLAHRRSQDTNVIRTIGRDGSIVEREVTDEQMALFRSMLDQFIPVSDENV